MCLVQNDEATEKFRKKNKNKKVVVWKVYHVSNGDVSPVLYNDGGDISHGYIISDRKGKNHDEKDWFEEINRGIHVYTSRGAAREMKDRRENVFKCTAEMSDLVAVGGYRSGRKDEAVFMKIHISKKEFEQGKKGRN